MGKKYANDFKLMVVELLKSGKTIKELSEEYWITLKYMGTKQIDFAL